MSEKTIKYFSMFSGIGGFEYGIEKADTQTDFECVGYSEIDKYAVSIYERHYPNHINYGDATRINTEDLPSFEFLVGGFPCQAFSIAGKRKGFEDTRGTLFFEIARILRDKKPSCFLLENVKGLLSHDRGRTIQTIFRVCDELGYDVQWAVYNSKDYGVPQNRERVFIKGYSRDKCRQEILFKSRKSIEINELNLNRLNKHKKLIQDGKIYGIDGVSITLDTPCGGLYYISDDKYATTTKNGDFFALTTRHRGRPFHKKQDNYIIEEKYDTFTKVSDDMSVTTTKDGDCFCLTQSRPFRPLNKRLTNYVMDNKEFRIRRLTPVECERLQGFPDNWTKYGKDNEPISDTQRYKCCGNAVTTNVISAIIEEMFQ